MEFYATPLAASPQGPFSEPYYISGSPEKSPPSFLTFQQPSSTHMLWSVLGASVLITLACASDNTTILQERGDILYSSNIVGSDAEDLFQDAIGKQMVSDFIQSAAMDLQKFRSREALQVTISRGESEPTIGNGQIMRKRKVAESTQTGPPPLSQRQVGFSAIIPNAAGSQQKSWKVPVEIYDNKRKELCFDAGSSVTVMNKDDYLPSSVSTKTIYHGTISYLDGTTAKGIVYQDLMTIANLTLWMNILHADANIMDDADGIIGTGLTSYTQLNSLLETMVLSQTILDDLLTITMTPQNDGAVVFGALDPRIINDLEYTTMPVEHNSHWDSDCRLNDGQSFPCIFDTGCTYTFVPKQIASELFKSRQFHTVKADVFHDGTKGLFTFYRCDRKIPEIILKVGTIKTGFPFAKFATQAWTITERIKYKGKEWCALSIVGLEGDYAIMGSNFFKGELEVYTLCWVRRTHLKEIKVNAPWGQITDDSFFSNPQIARDTASAWLLG